MRKSCLHFSLNPGNSRLTSLQAVQHCKFVASHNVSILGKTISAIPALTEPRTNHLRIQRLIRFRTPKNVLSYGNAILPKGTSDARKATHAYLIEGDVFGAHKVTDKKVEIAKLEAPLAFSDIRTVRALGLNYIEHAKEVRAHHSSTGRGSL